MKWIAIAGSLLLLALGGVLAWRMLQPGDNESGVQKTSASARAERRLYDGAPPIIPHAAMGADCSSCHNQEGIEVPDLGYAPPSPHEQTAGMSAISRCTQCHVYQQVTTRFTESRYVPFRQDLRRGLRLHVLAPPVIPHQIAMRENCLACHSGPAAREEIRCSHPERARCQQCHVTANTREVFAR